jgi:hypothetical protein
MNTKCEFFNVTFGTKLPSYSSFFSLLVVLFTILIATSCSKQEVQNDLALKDHGVNSRSGSFTAAEEDTIDIKIAEIQSYYSKIKGWRDGIGLNTPENAILATESMEVVWNYFVSRPDFIPSWETTLTDSVVIGGESQSWTGTQALSVFEQIKTKISSMESGIVTTDRAIRMIDFSEPVFNDGITKIYFSVNLGHTNLTSVPENPASNNLTKWSADPGVLGLPPAICIGDAANDIALGVNQKLGFFAKNEVPLRAGNPLVDPQAWVIGPIVSTQTTALGTSIPVFQQPLPLFKNIQWTQVNGGDLSFLNPGADAPDYNLKGEYFVHFDFGPEASPGVPTVNEICFTDTKINNYINGNIFIGTRDSPKVRSEMRKKLLGNNRLTASLYGLVATYVNGVSSSVTIRNFPARIQYHEHPTIQYFAPIIRFAIPNESKKGSLTI